MKLLDSISQRLIRLGIGWISSNCHKCHSPRLIKSIDLALGFDSSGCLKCRIGSWMLGLVLSLLRSRFGADAQTLHSLFKDAYWRRGLACVIKGISRYGFKKPFTPGSPFMMVWNITRACNLRCAHCYEFGGSRSPDELSTQECLRILDEMADAGVVAVAFSGGEPLMRKDIFQILEHASDLGLYTAIASNGTLIDTEKAFKLARAGLGYIQISLDSDDPEIHDGFRGVQGSHSRAIQGIRNCQEAGITVCASATLTKMNYDRVEKMLDFLQGLGVRWISLFNFVPTGRGAQNLHLDLDPIQRENVLRSLVAKLKYNPRIVSTAPQYARVALQLKEKIVPAHFYNPNLPEGFQELAQFIGGCGAGRLYLGMEPNGDITPCVFMPLKIGNILEQDLDQIWESEILIQLRNRDKLKPHCGICDFKYVCGGCRARAYGYLGDYLGPDPGCIRNSDVFRELKFNSKLDIT